MDHLQNAEIADSFARNPPMHGSVFISEQARYLDKNHYRYISAKGWDVIRVGDVDLVAKDPQGDIWPLADPIAERGCSRISERFYAINQAIRRVAIWRLMVHTESTGHRIAVWVQDYEVLDPQRLVVRPFNFEKLINKADGTPHMLEGYELQD